MEFRKTVKMTLYSRQQKDMDIKNRLSDYVDKAIVGQFERITLKIYITICKIDNECKFDA